MSAVRRAPNRTEGQRRWRAVYRARPYSRWSATYRARCSSRKARLRRNVSGGGARPIRSPHHSPDSGSTMTSRCAGNRRPCRSRSSSGRSRMGSTAQPSRSTTTRRWPATASSRRRTASDGTTSPRSARSTVRSATLARSANSRWLTSAARRARRTYWSAGNGSGRVMHQSWRCRRGHGIGAGTSVDRGFGCGKPPSRQRTRCLPR